MLGIFSEESSHAGVLNLLKPASRRVNGLAAPRRLCQKQKTRCFQRASRYQQGSITVKQPVRSGSQPMYETPGH